MVNTASSTMTRNSLVHAILENKHKVSLLKVQRSISNRKSDR